MLNTAIVGASGYSGELLVKFLARHREVRLGAVTSRSLAGRAVGEVMPKLRGTVAPSLRFTPSEPAALAANDDLQLVFLALPHGVAAEYAIDLVEAGKRVIDLSADFRLGDAATYERYYGKPHPAPELLARAAYVLPEVTAPGWHDAPLIAAPGCYPTSILIALVPLLRANAIAPEGIVISSMSGVSGAGKKVAEDYIYCARNESVKAYGLPRHRHLSEVEEQLSAASGKTAVVQFCPHLAPMSVGIASTIIARPSIPGVEPLYELWRERFSGSTFINVLPPDTRPDTAHVVGTNRLDLSAVYDERTGNVIITTALDNLIKGASGQAVQIMNHLYGFPEAAGLL